MGTYDKALLVLGEAEQIASQLVEDNKVRPSFWLVLPCEIRLTTFAPFLRSLSRKDTLLASKHHPSLSISSTPTSSTTYSPSAPSVISSSSLRPPRSSPLVKPKQAKPKLLMSLEPRRGTQVSSRTRFVDFEQKLILVWSRFMILSC